MNCICVCICVCPMAASDTIITTVNRWLLHYTGPVCSWPRHLRRLWVVHADARWTYYVTMLCRASSAMPNPSLRTIGRTSEASCRAGRPSGLPDTLTPVGHECRGPTDILPEDLWPHYWCSHHSALVAGSGTNSVQAGCSGIQSSSWRCIISVHWFTLISFVI